jgi:hypothetical protein
MGDLTGVTPRDEPPMNAQRGVTPDSGAPPWPDIERMKRAAAFEASHKPGCPGYQVNCTCAEEALTALLRATGSPSGPPEPPRLTVCPECDYPVYTHRKRTRCINPKCDWELQAALRGGQPGLREQLEAQIPNQQAVEEAYRKAGEKPSAAALNYEVRGGQPGAPPPQEDQK